MDIYISHPIAGMTEEQKVALEDAGARYAKMIMNGNAVLPRQTPPFCGVQASIPAECRIPGKVLPNDTHSVQCYMRGDIARMLTCDAVLVMPGWQASAGCRDEVNVAAMTGIPITFFDARVGVTATGVGGVRLR